MVWQLFVGNVDWVAGSPPSRKKQFQAAEFHFNELPMWQLRNKAADGRTKKYLFEMPAESLPTRLASVKRWESTAKTMAAKMLGVFFLHILRSRNKRI